MRVEHSNEFLRINVDYSSGGSLTSIYDINRKREWLVQSSVMKFTRQRNDFSSTGYVGWDEMLPTIVGAGLPDHGDLWCEKWDVHYADQFRSSAFATSMSSGVRLKRTLQLDPKLPIFTLDYEATTQLEQSSHFMWTAHPLFAADSGAWVSIESDNSWIQTFPTSQTSDPLPKYPLADIPAGSSGKWWSTQDGTVSSATLHQPDGATLCMQWDNGPIQWLGVWVDNGEFSPQPCIAFEPSTGWYDDLNRAIENGTSLQIDSNTIIRWRITVQSE